MIKKLLFSAAVAAVAISANAEAEVLWEDADGFTVEWGTGIVISKEDAAAKVKVGDYLVVDVSAVNTESGWPQVQLNANTNDPENPDNMLFIACQGGLTGPTVLSFPILGPTVELFNEYGIQIQGDGQTITKVSVEKGTVEIGPNTVWFGPEQLNWGVAIGIDKSVFADVKVGDKLEIYVDNQILKDENGDPLKDDNGNDQRKEATLQVIFGGWSGANVATYERWSLPSIIEYNEEDGIYTYNLNEEMEALERGEGDNAKVFNCLEELKNNGLVMQGPCLVYQVKYIQGDDDPSAVTSIENSNVAPVYYDMQGRKIANPQNGNIYIVKKGTKASKVVF